MKRGGCLLSRLVLYFVFVSGISAKDPISSPEGTTTTYVREKGPQVYAPRAGRAQKVEFDTPDKQLIYAPDTPFRRFFESRAADFEPDKLEYAKTTILGDVIAMLRSKQYLRDVIAGVVEDHKKTAISAECPLAKAERLAPKITKETTSFLDNAIRSTNSAKLEFPQRVEASLFLFSELIKPYTNNVAMGRTFRAATDLVPTLKSFTNAPANQMDIALLDTIDALSAFTNALEASSILSGIGPKCDEAEKWRQNHARLLIDFCELEILQGNYPEMEDGEITELVEKTLPSRDVWLYVIDNLNSPGVRAFQIELSQRLRRHDWLRPIVDRAVAKRADLFKKASSPLEGLRETQSAFQKFVEKKLISPPLIQTLRSDSTSLWEGFLVHANSRNDLTNRFLLQFKDNRTRNMEPEELRAFGKDLRQELVSKGMGSDGTLESKKLKEALDILLSRSETAAMLCPEYGSGTIKELEEGERANWSNSLVGASSVLSAFHTTTNLETWTNNSLPVSVLTNLTTRLQTALRESNNQRHKDQMVDTSPIEKSIEAKSGEILKEKHKGGKGAPPELSEFVKLLLAGPLPLSTAKARQKFVSDFDAVFSDNVDLLVSDEAPLKAFLASDKAKYSLPELRKKAVTLIPSRFYAKVTPGDGVTNCTAIFKQITDDPEIAYLFGSGLSNPQVVEAFKQEFCSLFGERQTMQAALEAEREADYDYWWLTFYPKAIPLGSKRLQGASILEVGFPESVVPESQYHRWLQDTTFSDGAARSSSRSGGRREFDSVEIIKNVDLRNATTLLRDMLNVLEAVELKSRYAELRPMLIGALDAFTRVGANAKEPFQAGIDVLKDAVAGSRTSRKRCSYDPKRAPDKNDAEELSECYKQKVEDEVLCYVEQFEKNRGDGSRPLAEAKRAEIRKKLWDLDLSKAHILFSVIALAETHARLPEKVNLFLWAQAQGVGAVLNDTSDITNSAELLGHVMNLWFDGEPMREDPQCEFSQIPKNSMKAMRDEANLYQLILNSYFSSYPEVPAKESIREAYFDLHPERLLSIAYDWIDYSGALYYTNNPALKAKFVAKASFLTEKGRKLLRRCLDSSVVPPPQAHDPNPTHYRLCLSNAVYQIFSEPVYSPLVKELDEKLFDNYYNSLWEMLGMIEETERHPVPYHQIRDGDYTTFRSWGRPVFQKGIQIVEMLPASRDDLVSMSVNEGGVVARMAAQAEGSAAYDFNQLKMAQRYADIAGTSLGKLLSKRQDTSTNDLNSLKEALDETSSSRRNQVVKDLANLSQSVSSQGYSAGATVGGSVYARARAALAYSRRREYLDAAITAAGRGDNYAKWVIRTSDLRSDLAKGAGKKLVAAAHSGFPNGDQPFHLLAKVPRRAVRSDWNGRKYIHFNSTYVATSRESAWKNAGFMGLLAKAPFALFNPNWWTQIEEGLVGTQYPFMWDVRNEKEQTDLLRVPNILGGAIWLDDTDKIKYSEVQDMLTAEENFIGVTRAAQTRDLGATMTAVEKESGEFQAQARQRMDEQRKALQKSFSDAQAAEGVTNRLDKLETELKDLRTRLNATNQTQKTGS